MKIWPYASGYLKNAANKLRITDAVEAARSKIPVSLSVNVRVNVPHSTRTGETTTTVVPTPEPDRIKQSRVQDEKSAQDLFEAAMNEFVESNEHEPRSSTPNPAAAAHQVPGSNQSQSVIDPKHKSEKEGGSKDTSVSLVPRLSRSAIYTRSKQLVRALYAAGGNTMKQVICLQELNRHILLYPEAAAACVNEGAIPQVLHLRSLSTDRALSAQSRQALALLGYSDPPQGRGIRILSIDGGGIRGIVILEVLRRLENLTGRPIYQQFDMICGVSTGAILTMLIGAMRKDITTCDELYRTVSKSLLVPDFWRGTSRLLLTHAYYDTAAWEKILRHVFTERSLIDTATVAGVPKIMAVSASLSSRIKPYVFRNFNLPVTAYGQYQGSCTHKIWESVRASSSAPGYFEDFVCGNHVHSDGGILINNPAAIAIHEAQLIWPKERIQCVVSIGTGKYTPVTPHNRESDPIGPTSLKAKITSLVDSATDTEITHRLLQDLLPEGTYFRMNPTLSEWLGMDENRPEKLDQLKTDAAMYVRKNEHKMQEAADTICQQRTPIQRTVDYVKSKYHSSVK